MNLTDLSTKHWPSVAVAVALVALFGVMSVARLPIQLLPTIEQPQVSIQNFWRAAAPEEMESSIVEPQENVLRNTPGVTDITAFISRGAGFITLTFDVGTYARIVDFSQQPDGLLGIRAAGERRFRILERRRARDGLNVADVE